ncbi:LytR/AlgR family response regulator transcription factor [Chitinophagaceae bacterium MMS25-I14]
MSLRIIIVDDELAIRQHIEGIVATLPDCVLLGSCGSVAEAKVLLQATKPDLLLLDIQLSDGTAFDLLQDEDPSLFKIIFITAYNQYAINAIKVGAIDYLLKPFDRGELEKAIGKTEKAAHCRKEMLEISRNKYLGHIPKKLVLRSSRFLQIVEIESIMYCQSYEGYSTFYFNNGQKFMVSHALKTYEDILTPPAFVRCHQSYLVNVDYISRFLHEGIIVLKNEQQIPVSQRRKETILSIINML